MGAFNNVENLSNYQTMGTNSSSGFTENIVTEVNNAEALAVDKCFHDIKEIYVSESGPTRVLSATRYGKHYALKCLKADFLYTPVYRQALNKEFEIGLKLEHPSICQTIGMEDVDGYGPCIIQELIDGYTLEYFMQTRQFTKVVAEKILMQLLDALEYMHNKQVYHRDLKPSNIMVTYNGYNAKIIDFSLSDSDAFSVLKSPAGTMGYLAPEQLKPGAKANARADIYSLGRIFQDMANTLHSEKLQRLGNLCAQSNPKKRPFNIAEVRLAAQKKYYSPIVVALCAACAVFAFLIILGLFSKNAPAPSASNTVQEGQKKQEMQMEKPDADNNVVTDYRNWPVAKKP